MIAPSGSDDDDVAGACVGQLDGSTEPQPRAGDAIALRWLPAGLRATIPMKWPHHGVRAGLMPRAARRRLLFFTSCSPAYCCAWVSIPADAVSGDVSARNAAVRSATTFMSWSPSQRYGPIRRKSRRSTWFCCLFPDRLRSGDMQPARTASCRPSPASSFPVHRKKFAPSADAHMHAPSRSAFGNASRSRMKNAPESKG